MIDCSSEGAAKNAVKAQGWSPVEWRFIEEKPADWRPGDRFPWGEDSEVRT